MEYAPWLELLKRAAHTYDTDPRVNDDARVLRMPFTVNVPDARKLKKNPNRKEPRRSCCGLIRQRATARRRSPSRRNWKPCPCTIMCAT